MNQTILKKIWVAAFFSSFLINQALATETITAPTKYESISKEKLFAEAYRPLTEHTIAQQFSMAVNDYSLSYSSNNSNAIASANTLDIDELPNNVIIEKTVEKINEENRHTDQIAEIKDDGNFFSRYLNTTQNIISKGVDFFNPSSTDNTSLFGKYKIARDSIIAQGMEYIGIKYKWGGTTEETGFDCSGLVRAVFQNSIGMTLPRTSLEMSKVGENIRSIENLKPGDLVFFNTMRRSFSHVGIYIGDNKFLHSPRKGAHVRVEQMNVSYWKKRFNGARRIEVNNMNMQERK